MPPAATQGGGTQQPTQTIQPVRTINDVLALVPHTKLQQLIAGLPVIKQELRLRSGRDIPNINTSVTYRTALIAHIRGDSPHHNCINCDNGDGKFKDCIILNWEGLPQLGGSCTNCYWGGQGLRCTFRTENQIQRNNLQSIGVPFHSTIYAQARDYEGIQLSGQIDFTNVEELKTLELNLKELRKIIQKRREDILKNKPVTRMNTPLPQNRVRNPAVQNPAVQNPAVQNPAVQNPAVQNPAVQNPAVQNPAVQNPAVQNPAVQNPAVQNPAVQNPAVQNPAVQNPAEDPDQEKKKKKKRNKKNKKKKEQEQDPEQEQEEKEKKKKKRRDKKKKKRKAQEQQ